MAIPLVCSRAELRQKQIEPFNNTVSVLENDVHNALRAWHQSQTAQSHLGYLRYIHNLVRGEGRTEQAANVALFEETIRVLRESGNDDDALLVKEHYDDELSMQAIVSKKHIAEATFYKQSQKARAAIAENILLLEQEARIEHRTKQRRQFEAVPSTTLIGTEEVIATLRGYLALEHGHNIYQLNGPGGIGKTSIAASVARYLTQEERFDQVLWISLQQEKLADNGRIRWLGEQSFTKEFLVDWLFRQYFPKQHHAAELSTEEKFQALKEQLALYPACIIIDNIENVTALDPLIHVIEQLAESSKILLTSREELVGVNHTITPVAIPELSEHDAIRLMREVASKKRLSHFSELSDETLKEIYKYVGGHPLAIYLLIGQIDRYGLDEALKSLTTESDTPTHNLFEYIYANAWQRLSQPAQLTLFALLLLPLQGGELDRLVRITQMARGQLLDALEELFALSLVQGQSQGAERLFSLHPLTATFLNQERHRSNPQLVSTGVLANFDACVVQAVELAEELLEDTNALLAETPRQQILHTFRYGLELASRDHTIWPTISALLNKLVPYFERYGYDAEWANYVRQSIVVSESLDDAEQKALLQAHLGALYRTAGHYADAHEMLQQSTDYFKENGKTKQWASVTAIRAYMYAIQRRHELAEPLIEQVLEQLSVTDPQREYVYYIQGLLALNNNDGVTAEQHFKQALQCCELLQDKRLMAKNLRNLGTALYHQDSPEQALAFYERAVVLHDELQEPVESAIDYIGIALIALIRKQPHKVIAALDKAEPALTRVHDILHLGTLDVNYALALHQLKEWDRAAERFYRAISRYQSLMDYYRAGNAYFCVGQLMTAQQLVGEARQAFLNALDCLMKCEPSPARDALRQQIDEELEQLG